VTSIGIIGSGFGALSVAIEMIRHGHTDVRLWERGSDLGGVWRDNTYPGAGCDVPSPLYSFSFEPSTRWSRRYGLQGEIIDYLHEVAEKYGVTDRISFGHEVTAADWDDATRTWRVTFADGGTDTVDVLVPAVGQLSRPRTAAIPGIDDFGGTSFHSAQWDHTADLSGRVAVIGAGASAIQFVPHLAGRARELTVFQRSPNYILPKPDGPFARWYRPLVRAERPLVYGIAELFSQGLDDDSLMGRANRRVALGLLRLQVKDPVLRARLTPDYPIGCKRILFSNDYYPTLVRPHVDLVSDRVERITPGGVVSGGIERPYDAIVHATGFDTQDFLDSIAITGPDGRRLSEQWRDGARAYLGIYVPHFPNLFVSYGPNTNLGGGSIIYMLEAQARHMRRVVDRMVAGQHRTAEVTGVAEQRWDDDVQGRLSHSAWAHCDSWYRHESGRITSNWPGATHPYARRTAQLDVGAFAWA
jgi:cation diffusion facilitator CzcD-associated flavoprotein CzcO